MKEGWIKIHRKLLDSAIFSEPKLLQFWIYCLCKASTKEKEMIVGKQEVKLGKGQFIFGRKKAGADLKISETTAFRNLKFLEKMNMARTLLERSNLSISIVASKVGYDNFSHFSKMFKKLTDMTPQEYRKEHQK